MSRACKKRKKKTGLKESFGHPWKRVPQSDSCSLQDEIVNHLQLLKECKALVVGFNAVMRGIGCHSLIAVLMVTRRAALSMGHALDLVAQRILLLRLQDIDSLLSSCSIPPAATYGIKSNELTMEPKLSKLSERIHGTLKKNSNQKKTDESPQMEVKRPSADESCLTERTDRERQSVSNSVVVHSKHCVTRTERNGEAEAFISLEVYAEPENEYFPNYATDWEGISMAIKH